MPRNFPIIFINNVLRTDDFVDNNISVNVTVNFSSSTTFFVIAVVLLSGILLPLN
jgi:hypothetical protein